MHVGLGTSRASIAGSPQTTFIVAGDCQLQGLTLEYPMSALQLRVHKSCQQTGRAIESAILIGSAQLPSHALQKITLTLRLYPGA